MSKIFYFETDDLVQYYIILWSSGFLTGVGGSESRYCREFGSESIFSLNTQFQYSFKIELYS